MDIEVINDEGLCHTQVEGELTIYTVTNYRQAFLEQSQGCHGVKIDLAGVTEIDTAGVQLLVALRQHLIGTESGLQLCNPSESVQEALELTRLANEFAVSYGGNDECTGRDFL